MRLLILLASKWGVSRMMQLRSSFWMKVDLRMNMIGMSFDIFDKERVWAERLLCGLSSKISPFMPNTFGSRRQHLAANFGVHRFLLLSIGHVSHCQRGVCSLPGALRCQLLHPPCQHTTCTPAGSCLRCGTAKCFRRSWVCRILEPCCYWGCTGTAGCSRNRPACFGGGFGEWWVHLPGQLHCLPCWWQQHHRGWEEAQEGCPGHLRQVRCWRHHHPGHQRQRRHARLRWQAWPWWHWGATAWFAGVYLGCSM